MTERSSPEGELVRDTPAEEREASRYLRLPMPVVALGLLIVLAVLFAVGLYANRNLRPQGASVPPTAAAAAVAPTSTPLPLAAQPTSTAAAAPTAAPTITRQPTATPQPTAVATLAPTAAPTALVVGTAATPPANAPPTPLPTVEPTLAAEVGQSYEYFWHVTSQALLQLDTTHLSEVMDGDYLAAVSNRITELRAEGRAIKTQVVLNYAVIEATSDSASVVDDFVDNSVYVSSDTEEPLSDPVGDQVRTLYKLRNNSGTWKVVESVRSE